MPARMVFFFDPVYFVILIVTLVISGGAQLYIKSTFSKWDKVQNSGTLSGMQVGERIVSRANFGGATGTATGINFKVVPGNLSDHFNPATKQVGLSQDVATKRTVAAMAVTAHEVGHAQQDAEGTVAMKARAFLVPAVTVSPMISYGLIFIGLIFNNDALFGLGIIVFAVMVLFSVMTLPVEIGASRRALVLLRDSGMLARPDDEEGVKRVLAAAALTYVAAAVTSILMLLYYVSLARR
ncbi:MAG: zinc metallopeptidase [Chloroflexota bacterium]